MEIAEKIQKVREATGKSRKEFGMSLGVTEGYIGQIELGKKIPRNTFLELMMLKYKVNIDWWEIGEGEIFEVPQQGLRHLHEEVDKAWYSRSTDSGKFRLAADLLEFMAALEKNKSQT